MRNVTLSRTVKLWGEWIKSGKTIEVADCEYEQLLKDGFLIEPTKEEIKTKPKKENDKLENNS